MAAEFEFNADGTRSKIEVLEKDSSTRNERTGMERDANTPQFEQTGIFIPSVRLAQIEQQVTVLFDLDIHPDIAVSQRHRTGGIVAGSCPDKRFRQHLKPHLSWLLLPTPSAGSIRQTIQGKIIHV